MASGKRIVITGATGFLGPRLVKHLAGRGDTVVALVRNVESARRRIPQAAEFITWSSSSAPGAAAAAVDGADAVINLAGSTVATRWSEAAKRSIYNSRIQGTRALVQAMSTATRRPHTLINASAVGYYGTSPTTVFTEDSPAGSDFLAQVCHDWEAEAIKAEPLGIRVVRVRTGVVLDPHQGALAKLLPTFKLFVGGAVASGRQWMPWIHVDDEIGIILWALDNEQVSGPINAAAPNAVTNRELSTVIGETLHRPSMFTVPKFVFDLVLGEGSLILVEGQRVAPERTTRLGYRFLHPELREAMNDLLK